MYNTKSLSKYTLEVIQEEYCATYFDRYGRFPPPDNMSKNELISQISKMRSFMYSEQDALSDYNRSSAHSG